MATDAPQVPAQTQGKKNAPAAPTRRAQRPSLRLIFYIRQIHPDGRSAQQAGVRAWAACIVQASKCSCPARPNPAWRQALLRALLQDPASVQFSSASRATRILLVARVRANAHTQRP